MNREEQIANAEKATVDSIREQRFAKTAELVKIPGHPLHTFTLENEALAKTIKKCREALKSGHVEYKLIEEVRQLAIHYAVCPAKLDHTSRCKSGHGNRQ